MLSWQAALGATDMGYINVALKSGLSNFVYRELANYFVSQTIGFAHATGIIRQSLPSFSGAVFGNVYWGVRQEFDQNNYISGLRGSDYISEDRYIERPLSQPRKYRYIGEYSFFDERTRDYTKEYKSFYYDEPLSVSEANTYLYESFDTTEYGKERYITSVKFINAEHNMDWEY